MTERGSRESEKLIVCQELVKIYRTEDSRVMALQGLELEIRRGEMLAMIGKSGSGKSTLLNMIGGLETPSAGRLLVEGRDMAAYTAKEMELYRKNKIGFVWQKSARNLMPYLTAQQNVEMPMCFSRRPGRQRRRRAEELLQEVGLEQMRDRYPGQLSGGEQQRVALAVALANDPVILLADEPTGAVDTTTARHIFRLLHRLNAERGLTILIVTHDRELAGQVNRTVRISDGKISTEKLRRIPLSFTDLAGLTPLKEQQEEYVVLDRARRLQLSEAVLEKAGIRSRMVKVEAEEGKVMITEAECPRHDSPDVY